MKYLAALLVVGAIAMIGLTAWLGIVNLNIAAHGINLPSSLYTGVFCMAVASTAAVALTALAMSTR